MKHTYKEWYHMAFSCKSAAKLGITPLVAQEVIRDWGEERLELNLRIKRLERQLIKLQDSMLKKKTGGSNDL